MSRKDKIKIKLDFYDILSLGYAEFNSNTIKFGNCASILSDLSVWLNDKKIRETNTFTPKPSSNLDGVYCVKLSNNPAKSSFLLTIWNEIPNKDGSVSSVGGDKPVGNYEINNTSVPEGFIPGFPTYFWFMPELKIFVSVRINETLQIGKDAMMNYILGYMGNYSTHVVELEDGTRQYAENDDCEACSMTPVFKSKQIRNAPRIEYIKSCQSKIRKLIRKEIVSLKNPTKKRVIHKLTTWLGIPEPTMLSEEKEIKYRYELDYSPSMGELETMIAECTETTDGYSDLGFLITCSNTPIWLNTVLCKTDDEILIEFKEDNQTIDTDHLFELLEQKRASYLAQIKR